MHLPEIVMLLLLRSRVASSRYKKLYTQASFHSAFSAAKFREVLKLLEDRKIIRVQNRRKDGSFQADTKITFRKLSGVRVRK